MITKRISGRGLMAAWVGAALLADAGQAHALTITPYFDPSITGRADATVVEAAIKQVVQTYSMFTNPDDVNIYFQFRDIGGGGGASRTTLYRYTYGDYTAALAADSALHPENQVLAEAVPNLPYGNRPATTGKPFLVTGAANARALGDPTAVGVLGADGVAGHGIFDGIVTLDVSPLEYSFGSVVGPNQESAITVLYHEVDEVLSVGGPASGLRRFPVAIGPDDLYRYAGYHTPSYTTAFSWNPATDSYFSIDGGATRLTNFNQTGSGDYADYARYACNDGLESVQEWTGCYGEPMLKLHAFSTEGIELQAIGYNVAVPEPAAWLLMLGGFGLIGSTLRRRPARAAD